MKLTILEILPEEDRGLWGRLFKHGERHPQYFLLSAFTGMSRGGVNQDMLPITEFPNGNIKLGIFGRSGNSSQGVGFDCHRPLPVANEENLQKLSRLFEIAKEIADLEQEATELFAQVVRGKKDG